MAAVGPNGHRMAGGEQCCGGGRRSSGGARHRGGEGGRRGPGGPASHQEHDGVVGVAGGGTAATEWCPAAATRGGMTAMIPANAGTLGSISLAWRKRSSRWSWGRQRLGSGLPESPACVMAVAAAAGAARVWAPREEEKQGRREERQEHGARGACLTTREEGGDRHGAEERGGRHGGRGDSGATVATGKEMNSRKPPASFKQFTRRSLAGFSDLKREIGRASCRERV